MRSAAKLLVIVLLMAQSTVLCALPTGEARFSPNGAILAEPNQDDTIVLWDVVSGTRICTLYDGPVSGTELMANYSQPTRLSFSPDSKLLATQRYPEPIILWDVQNGREMAAFVVSYAGPAPQFSADSRLILSIGNACGPVLCPGIITVWEIKTQKELFRVHAGENKAFDRVTFSPDGKMVMAYLGERLDRADNGYRSKSIKLWDIARAEELASLEGSSMSSASFSPDSKYLLITDPQFKPRVWDIKERKMRTIGESALPSKERDLWVDNVAAPAGNNEWNWAVFITGDRLDIDEIKCVQYKLHHTFANPVRTVCEMGDPQRPFALSATGWGTFPIAIRVFMKDGTHQDLKHQLKF